jgi:hypothetical protein
MPGNAGRDNFSPGTRKKIKETNFAGCKKS